MGLLYKNTPLCKVILDSLESQEGGAMYISCDVSNAGPLEPETGYVPNNPLFGLALDSPQQECAADSCVGCLSCQSTTAIPIPLTSHDFDCGSCFDSNPNISILDVSTQQHNIPTTPTAIALHELTGSDNGDCYVNNSCGANGSNNSNSYWSGYIPDEMASTFQSLSSLEIDPLPSLFPFSPCGSSYNFSTNAHHHHHHQAIPYAMHPHQMLVAQNGSGGGQSQGGPHQVTHSNALSSAGQSCYDPIGGIVGGNGVPGAGAGGGGGGGVIVPASGGGSACGGQHIGSTAAPPASTIYPSMSVNVSMNMTMHGYGSDGNLPIQCSQVQWSQPNNSSSMNVLYPPLLSPSHYPAAATYSFTADFRTPPHTNLHANQNATNTTTIPTTLCDSGVERLTPPTAISPKNFYTGGISVTGGSANGGSQGYASPEKSPIDTQLRDTKSYGSIGFDDEDSNDDGSDSKTNLCRLCGKTYARPSTLKTHLRTHSGERPYRCPDCNKSFSQAANLTAHVRTHTGQKPFRCPICDRRFSQSSSVTTHMRTHSGERPYRCSSCKKSFSDSSTLTKHLRIHSGEKPYQCKLCLLRFSQSGNLNRHMRVHSGNNNNNNNEGTTSLAQT